jgi:hypothetical protein
MRYVLGNNNGLGDNMTYADWQDAEVTRMVDMFNKGLPNSKISRVLNHEFHNNEPQRPRNAVVGKLHRMGHKRESPHSFNAEQKTLTERAKKKGRMASEKPKPLTSHAMEHKIKAPDLSTLPPSTGETLIQMTGNGCKNVDGANKHGEAVYCGR